MARPRDLHEAKKTEQFTIRLPDEEALIVYREASRREIPPAVLMRKAIRVGMHAMMNASSSEYNKSIRGYESPGDSEDSGFGLLTGTEE